jgi:glycosyltransferase involved in cell wall biosynthesis
LFSILVPVHDTPAQYLREMIASVQAQLYPHWELCLADDASTAGHVGPLLEEYARADARIRPVFRTENGHIARATNTALGLATGEFVALLDHDDLLAPEALLRVAAAIRAHPDAQFLYTDRDKVDSRERHFDVELRGAWNPAMAITHNYLHQLTVIRRTLVERIGGFRPDYFGSQDLDLYLRCHELIQPHQIVHVPVIAYHWRAHAGSTASRGDQKDYMFDSAYRGIVDALQRRRLRARPFLPGFAPLYGLNLHQLHWDPALLRENPVSIVLAAGPGDDWRRALAAIARTVSVALVEVIVVSAGPTPELDPSAAGMPVELVPAPAGESPAGLFNRGAAAARHSLLLLMRADAMPETPGWLEDLVGWLSDARVEAVGPKLVKGDGRLASAAWTLNPVTELPEPLFMDEAPDDLGHQFLLQCARDTLILDPACLLTRTVLFREMGGYADHDFPVEYYAADYCLRLHDRGRRIVYTPQAVLHLWPGSASRPSGSVTEAVVFKRRHPDRTDPWIRPELHLPIGKRPGRSDAARPEWMPEGTVEFAGGWFFLEHPQPGEVMASGRQVIHGWCVSRADSPIDELRVRVGRQLRLLTYGHPRLDLADLADVREEFYPVGFDLELDLPLAGPDWNLRPGPGRRAGGRWPASKWSWVRRPARLMPDCPRPSPPRNSPRASRCWSRHYPTRSYRRRPFPWPGRYPGGTGCGIPRCPFTVIGMSPPESCA